MRQTTQWEIALRKYFQGKPQCFVAEEIPATYIQHLGKWNHNYLHGCIALVVPVWENVFFCDLSDQTQVKQMSRTF